MTGTVVIIAMAIIAGLPASHPLRFWNTPASPLGQPAAHTLVNHEGSPRITQPVLMEQFYRELGPRLVEWTNDGRLNVNPNYVVAVIAKESGFEPHATSWVPANGIAQMTHIADADLRIIAREAPAFQWMHKEVESWPRHPIVHREKASKLVTDSLIARSELGAHNEYLFDAGQSLRASLFWLRILAEIWTKDEWPGEYGTFAKKALNGGRTLSESQLLNVVTVSYNQGHPYVKNLIVKHGVKWTDHLNEESSDYLERIRHYTELFQRAGAAGAD